MHACQAPILSLWFSNICLLAASWCSVFYKQRDMNFYPVSTS